MGHFPPPPPVRRRRLEAAPSPGGPPMVPRMMPLVGSLMREIRTETDGRELFAVAARGDFQHVAATFGRYRITPLAVIRQTDASARRTSLSDLRELGRRSYPDRQKVMRSLSHFSPKLAKQRTAPKDPLFEEVGAPGANSELYIWSFLLLGAVEHQSADD